MDHVEYAYTSGLNEADINERLRTAETGVLALCENGDSRAIPLAHYYDGEALYFRLGKTEGSEKWAAMETPGTATYVVYETSPTEGAEEIDSWSIHVTGHLRELPASDHDRFDTAEINRRFSPIRVFDEAIDDIDIAIVELSVETIAGRTTARA